jgi:lysophospholipase L1-like esterase
MPVVLCYGDSNTHGADPGTGRRLPPDVRWPGVLARRLAGVADVIEEGLNGRTTIWDDPFEGGRNGRTYLLPCLQSHAPIDVFVLMLGTNDLKGIFGLTADRVASGVASLVEIALTSGTGPEQGAPRVLLVAPAALGETTDRSELWGFGAARATSASLPRLYRVAAETHDVAFLDASSLVTVDPRDGVHLSPEAHGTLGRAVAEIVLRLLEPGP